MAESRPGSASNLDCAVIYTLVGQGAASDEDRGHLFYLAAYFIGLHEAETTSDIDDAFVDRYTNMTSDEVEREGPLCKARADGFEARMDVLVKRLGANAG